MGSPSYAYCAAYCSGKSNGCPHYVRNSVLFSVCYHYKLVNEHSRQNLNVLEVEQSKLEKIARDAGV